MAEFPTFEAFYEEAHGRPAFPWQIALARRVVERGWPGEIAIPTGLGKTAVISVALWAMAREAALPARERVAPRRIWYAVDRRLLVDAGLDYAERLRHALATAESDALAVVADSLRSLGASGLEDGPFAVISLRGGSPPRRLPEPSLPAVISSTVPMFGSRLLFRAYGSSASMLPIEAAHAGIDALVLLDEAHIAGPLMKLLRSIPLCDANRGGILRAPGSPRFGEGPEELLPQSRAYPKLVSLTATGDADDKFTLTPLDDVHPVVRRRLDAAKPVELVEAKAKTLVAALADRALAGLEALDRDGTAAIFVNTPGRAVEVADALEKRGFDGVVKLVTGRFREPDAADVRRDVLALAGTGRSHDPKEPVIVVATQTLEVGADLDFDVMVSEAAGVKALTQRFGRLNRLGDRPHALGALVYAMDDKRPTIYGDEPAAVWERLKGLGDSVDFSPRGVSETLGSAPAEDDRAPDLQPVHLWEFAKTAPAPSDAAPPAPFFAGVDERRATVMVAWRVAPRPGPLPTAPRQSEVVEIPIGAAREFLTERRSYVVRHQDGGRVLEELTEGVQPGDLIVLDAMAGGYGSHGWDPSAKDTVYDFSPHLVRSLPLNSLHVEALVGRVLTAEESQRLGELGLETDDAPDPEHDQLAAEEWLAWLQMQERPARCPEELWRFDEASEPRLERRGENLEPWLTWRLRGVPRDLPVEREDDLVATVGERRTLLGHGEAVGRRARKIAEHIGLPDWVVELVAEAGRFHDLGKADPRFQRWLGREVAGDLLAKGRLSRATIERDRIAAQWPKGGRHEALSVAAIESLAAAGVLAGEPEAIIHLVAAHHGHARPLIPVPQEASDPIQVEFEIDGGAVGFEARLGDIDWSQPSRFREMNERFGYWGLSLLESIVRQADHLESSALEIA